MVGFRELIQDSLYEMSSSTAYLSSKFNVNPELNSLNRAPWVDLHNQREFSIALLRDKQHRQSEAEKALGNKAIRCLQTGEPFGRLTDKQRVKLELEIEDRRRREAERQRRKVA